MSSRNIKFWFEDSFCINSSRMFRISIYKQSQTGISLLRLESSNYCKKCWLNMFLPFFSPVLAGVSVELLFSNLFGTTITVCSQMFAETHPHSKADPLPTRKIARTFFEANSNVKPSVSILYSFQ